MRFKGVKTVHLVCELTLTNNLLAGIVLIFAFLINQVSIEGVIQEMIVHQNLFGFARSDQSLFCAVVNDFYWYIYKIIIPQSF